MSRLYECCDNALESYELLLSMVVWYDILFAIDTVSKNCNLSLRASMLP